ncbi:hypothetical protein N9L68_03645 [bacterium]|nr:hypothetical protein [bacterium]
MRPRLLSPQQVDALRSAVMNWRHRRDQITSNAWTAATAARTAWPRPDDVNIASAQAPDAVMEPTPGCEMPPSEPAPRPPEPVVQWVWYKSHCAIVGSWHPWELGDYICPECGATFTVIKPWGKPWTATHVGGLRRMHPLGCRGTCSCTVYWCEES